MLNEMTSKLKIMNYFIIKFCGMHKMNQNLKRMIGWTAFNVSKSLRQNEEKISSRR